LTVLDTVSSRSVTTQRNGTLVLSLCDRFNSSRMATYKEMSDLAGRIGA